MSFRDELEAAHRRIAQLEEENAVLVARLAERDAQPPDERLEELLRRRRRIEEQRDALAGYGSGLVPVLGSLLVILAVAGIFITDAVGPIAIPVWVILTALVARFVSRTIRRGHQASMKRQLGHIRAEIAATRVRIATTTASSTEEEEDSVERRATSSRAE